MGLGRVALCIGYPPGTEKTTIGHNLFNRGNYTPNEHGVYAFDKINYKKPPYKNWSQEKTGEVVYFRKAKESDLEAIKEKFPHLAF